MPRLLTHDGTIVACLKRFDRSSTVIGSSPSADLCLPGDPLIEPEHARITWSDTAQAHLLYDCGSVDEILLNGAQLKRPTPLDNGARIRIGLTELIYCNRLPMPDYTSTLARRFRPARRLLPHVYRKAG
jgi:hypothetical protein